MIDSKYAVILYEVKVQLTLYDTMVVLQLEVAKGEDGPYNKVEMQRVNREKEVSWSKRGETLDF